MKYCVYTPAYDYGGSDYDPPEYGSDVAEVDAPTKREALVRGVRELRRTHSRWLQDRESDGHCPFTALKAEPLE